MTFDVDNRMTSWTGSPGTEEYGYLADNKRVWKKDPSGVETYSFYGVGGQKLVTYMVASTSPFVLSSASWNVYFGGKLIRANGETVVADRLGGVVARQDVMGVGGPTRHDYFPYGAEMGWAAPGNKDKFGTYHRDATTGMDYADQRYFTGLQGRFLSSDPYEASGGASEPGSWNRYLYVGGDPVNANDPKGLARCFTIGYDGVTGMADVNCTSALGTSYRLDVPYNGGLSERELRKAARDGEASAYSTDLDRQEAMSAIAPLDFLARKAFANQDCAKLFSGTDVISPTAALDLLWSRIEVSFGDLTTLTGPPVAAETTGDGLRVGTKSSFPYIGTYYQRAHITISTTAWIPGSEVERLAIFIHEIGHAISLLSVGEITGGFVHQDRSATVNRENDRLILEKCIKPLL